MVHVLYIYRSKILHIHQQIVGLRLSSRHRVFEDSKVLPGWSHHVAVLARGVQRVQATPSTRRRIQRGQWYLAEPLPLPLHPHERSRSHTYLLRPA